MIALLDDLLDADEADSIEITFDGGNVVGIATIDRRGDEIMFYEDADLDADLAAAAKMVPPASCGSARYVRF